MRTTLSFFAAMLFLFNSLGCQCCGVTEHYCDFIDDVSDCKPNLDRFYHAELDLNRIGKPDWCRSRINRALCRCQCEGRCGCSGHHPCSSGSTCNCPKPCLCGDAVQHPLNESTAPPQVPPKPAKSAGTSTSEVPYLLDADESSAKRG